MYRIKSELGHRGLSESGYQLFSIDQPRIIELAGTVGKIGARRSNEKKATERMKEKIEEEGGTYIPPRNLCNSLSPNAPDNRSQHYFLLCTAILDKHSYR